MGIKIFIDGHFCSKLQPLRSKPIDSILMNSCMKVDKTVARLCRNVERFSWISAALNKDSMNDMEKSFITNLLKYVDTVKVWQFVRLIIIVWAMSINIFIGILILTLSFHLLFIYTVSLCAKWQLITPLKWNT